MIEIHQLKKNYHDKEVLRGVDLSVAPGTVLGLLGQNGSGKSTLIKCALGLVRTTGGSATLCGDDAWSLTAETKARLGYVPQEVVSYPWMRVRQVIAYTAAFYPTWNQTLVDELCRRWQLPLEDRVGPLSVGQLQTLGIVLALGHEPDLLILDEPVASLDPNARREFLRTLLEISRDSCVRGWHSAYDASPARGPRTPATRQSSQLFRQPADCGGQTELAGVGWNSPWTVSPGEIHEFIPSRKHDPARAGLCCNIASRPSPPFGLCLRMSLWNSQFTYMLGLYLVIAMQMGAIALWWHNRATWGTTTRLFVVAVLLALGIAIIPWARRKWLRTELG